MSQPEELPNQMPYLAILGFNYTFTRGPSFQLKLCYFVIYAMVCLIQMHALTYKCKLCPGFVLYEREKEREGGREIETKGDGEKERERCPELLCLFLEGMKGALASYLVNIVITHAD